MKFIPEQDLEDRAVVLGEYIIEHKATVRAAAKHFGISKSTVHMVVTKQKIQFLLFCKKGVMVFFVP